MATSVMVAPFHKLAKHGDQGLTLPGSPLHLHGASYLGFSPRSIG